MSEIQQGLLITAIGMGLVFAVIIFLWGLMALMMRVTSGKREVVTSPEAPESPLVPQMQDVERGRRAAAAAVAVAMALEDASTWRSQSVRKEAEGTLNPWQAAHRTRQMERNTRG